MAPHCRTLLITEKTGHSSMHPYRLSSLSAQISPPIPHRVSLSLSLPPHPPHCFSHYSTPSFYLFLSLCLPVCPLPFGEVIISWQRGLCSPAGERGEERGRRLRVIPYDISVGFNIAWKRRQKIKSTTNEYN